jgi:hypothetical protein
MMKPRVASHQINNIKMTSLNEVYYSGMWLKSNDRETSKTAMIEQKASK